MIKDFLSRFGKGNQELQQLESQVRNERMVTQKAKNSNERELERFEEEDRQEMIKARLGAFRERQKARNRESVLLKNEPVFNHKSNILNNHSQLKEQNMFFGKGNMLQGGSI